MAQSECKKCGSRKGWDGPTYCYTPFYNGRYESLMFTCLTCGYHREEHTKDYVPPPPPPPAPQYVYVAPTCVCRSYKWWPW
jgi:hypothetical protein